MKAFLLAAGFGTRLKPLTDEIPKCLIPIHNKPLLYYWLDLLEENGIDEVLINTHYFPEKIDESVHKRKNTIKITIYFEKELLGTAGTIFTNRDFVKNEQDFFILYSDNLTNVSLTDLYLFHKSVDSLYTTYVYETKIPQQKGIFLIDESTGKVFEFEEKPAVPKSNLANAGIGVLNKKIFDYFYSTNQDFSKEILPKIIDKIYVLRTKRYIRDIGTIEDYNIAQKEWTNFQINI